MLVMRKADKFLLCMQEEGINEYVFGNFGVPSSSELTRKNDALKATLAQESFQRMRVHYVQRRSNQRYAAMQQKLAKSASITCQLNQENDKLQAGLLKKSSEACKLKRELKDLNKTMECNQQAANDFVDQMEAEYTDRVQYLQGRLQDLSPEADKQQAVDFLNEENNELAKAIADQRCDQIELDAREAKFTALKQQLVDIEARHTAAARQQAVAHNAETTRLRQAAAEIATQLQAAKSEAASLGNQLAASEEQKAAHEQQAAAYLAQTAAGHDEQHDAKQEAMSAQHQLTQMQNSHAE